MVTGDKAFMPGHPRFDLQRAAVDDLQAAYWGRGSLWPALPEGGIDVVTAQDPFWRGFFGLYAARKLGAKLNVQVHADLRGQRPLKRGLARFVLRHADSIRVVSSKLKEQVERLGARARVTVLPVFVDMSRFAGLEHRQHPAFAKTILWFGRFEREKDPLAALSVLRAVRKEGIDAGLMMLGRGSLQSAVVSSLDELAPFVEMAPWQDPLPFLAQADVVLCTSRHESWGASMVEALAAGVAVVAPDVGIAREAGAIVTSRTELGRAVAEVLRSGRRGELKLHLRSAEAWAQGWRESLI